MYALLWKLGYNDKKNKTPLNTCRIAVVPKLFEYRGRNAVPIYRNIIQAQRRSLQ